MKQTGLSVRMRRYAYPVITMIIFAILLGIAVFYVLWESKKVTSESSAHDVEQLSSGA